MELDEPDAAVLPEYPLSRLLEMLERLVYMRGALYARALDEAQDEPAQTGAVSGVTVGPQPGEGSPPSSRPVGSLRSPRDDVEVVESSGAMLTGHPEFAGLVEYVKV